MPVAEDFLADVGTQSADDFLGKEEPGKEIPLPTFEAPPGILPPTPAQLREAELRTRGISETEGGTQIQLPTTGVHYLPPLPTFTPPKEAGFIEKSAAGAWNVLAGIPNFLGTPTGVSTLMVPAALPASIAKPALQGTFSMLMAKSAGEQAGELTAEVRPGQVAPMARTAAALLEGPGAVAQIPQDVLESQAALQTIDPQKAVETLGAAAFVPLSFGGATRGTDYARRVSEAAKVYGDVQAQPVQGPRQVPAQEGGGGVQPQAAPVAQAAQVPLTERATIGGGRKTGFFFDYGGLRRGGFETAAAAKSHAELVEQGRIPMEGEPIPPGVDEAEHEMAIANEEVGAATFTDPDTGETTTGPHHPAAAAAQGVDATGPRESREGPEFGFMSTVGRKLTRDQAEKLAEETGQKLAEPKTGKMHSDETKGPGSDKPLSEMTQLEMAVGVEAAKVGKKAVVLDEPPTPEENVPFALNIAYVDRKSGRLVFNRRNLEEKLAQIPQPQQAAYLERLINEEHLHSHITDEQALAFHDNSTATEKALAFKQYTGFDSPSEFFKAKKAKITPTELGHEMIRQRMQQLSGLGTREVVELSGREKWSAQFIDALQRLIYNLRRALGTRASKVQQDMLNRAQGNIDAVKQARGGEPLGAFAKRRPEQQSEPVRAFDEALKTAKANTNTAVQTGLRLKSVQDLNDLGEMREDWSQRAIAAREAGYPAETMQDVFKAQFPREAIEAATNTGSHREGEGFKGMEVNYGKRPLDWQEHPEVADWLRQHGRRMGITLPQELTREAVPGAFKKPDRVWIDKREESDPIIIEAAQMFHAQEQRGDALGYAYDRIRDAEQEMQRWLDYDGPDQRQRYQLALEDQKRWAEVAGQIHELESTGASVDFEPPDDYTPSWKGAFKKESKKEREARIAREHATEALPGFGGPARSEVIPLKGEPPAPKPETLSERTTATAAGAGLPPELIAERQRAAEDKAIDYIAETDKPNFEEFARKLEQFHYIDRNQAALMFQNKTWDHLIMARGARLEQLVRSLGLEGQVFAREARQKGAVASRAPALMPEAGVKSIIPDNEQQEQFKLVQEVAGGKRFNDAELKAIRKQRIAQQKFRSRVISIIGRKLVGEVIGRDREVGRKDFTIEDVDWSNPDRVAGPFQTISEADARRPGFMERLFAADARRSNDDPVSYTKRLMVLANKNTGEIQVASAYPHGRSGLMVMRGAVPGVGERHIKYTDLPKNERPIFTILLKDPVQFFLKRFKNISEFNDYAHIEDATARNSASEFAEASGQGRKTPVLESESEPGTLKGGMFAGGPGGQEVAGLFRSTPGEILGRAERMPLEARELRSLFRLADQYEVREPRDLAELVKIIEQSAKERQKVLTYPQEGEGIFVHDAPGSLRGSHASAISAIVKAAAVEFKELKDAWTGEAEEARKRGEKFDVPVPTEEQAYVLALNNIFKNITQNKGVEDYIQRTLEQYRREPQEVSPTAAPTLPQLLARPREAAGVERELSMREPPPRMPPTRFPLPRTAEEPLPAKPEMLSPEGQKFVAREAAKKYPTFSSLLYTQLAHREVPKEPYRVGAESERPLPPGFRKPSAENLPGAFFKDPKDAVERELNKVGRGVVAAVQRRDMEDMIKATRDAASNGANNHQRRVENDIRMTAKNNPDILAAAIALVQSGFDQRKLADFVKSVDAGMVKAKWLVQNGRNWFEKLKGRQWVKSNRALLKELGYAGAHWNDADLQATAKKLQEHLDNQYATEVAAGSHIRYDPNYFPGRYEAEFFNDDAVVFGALHDLLGRNWKAPKTFHSYYEAAEAGPDAANPNADGPYIPASRDAAAIAGSRVRQGLNSVNYNAWAQTLRNYIDPVSGQAAATSAIRRPDRSYAPTSPEHVLWYPRPGHEPLSIRKSIEPLIDNLTRFSSVQRNAFSRNVLELSQRLKHTILIGDFFHLGRVGYYAASLLNPLRASYTKGLAAIEYFEKDLPRAVAQGLISQKSADWATEKVSVNLGGGRTTMMSRIEIADLGQRMGLNNGRIQDALYSNLVQKIPGIGTYNRWLFDKVTRGFITQSFVHQFEALNKAHPEIDSRTLARDVAKDINRYFGNIGRQGWITSATWQDIARMTFLAPQWVEGLVMKEAGLYARVAGAPFGYRKGLPKMGALGKGMAAGLVTMVAVTQALNLIFRRQPTWQNKEEGHQWDAFIPTDSEGNGLWFSPLAVFNELSHDVWRLAHTKPKVWDIVSQIAQNKLSPYGRAALVGVRSATPTGQYITTTGGVGKEMARQLAPVPISFSRPLQEAAHFVAPGLVPPTARGQLARQMFGTAGLKMEPSVAPAQQFQAKAEQFMLDHPELKKNTGWMQVQTDEPNYTKLRSAIRNGDEAGAKREFEALRKSRSDADILKAMRLNSNRPFTGSRAAEGQFLYSLSPQELESYTQALTQKQAEYEAFLEWYIRQASP